MVQFIGDFTEAMKDYTRHKLEKLEKQGMDVKDVRVKLDIVGENLIVEVSVNNKIRNTEIGTDFYKLLVKVIDNLCLQDSRYKDYYENKKAKEDAKNISTDEIEIARNKIIFLNEMSQEDAIEQMELLGHTFFVFKDIDSRLDDCQVVYKRKDGTYGIIHCR